MLHKKLMKNFNLGKTLSKATSLYAKVGGVVGLPGSNLVGQIGGVSRLMGGSGGVPKSVALSQMSMSRLPMPSAGGRIGTITRGGVRSSRTITLPSGSRVNATKIWRAVRDLGPEAVALSLGLSANEMATWLLEHPAKSGRRRGITARQLQSARRVNRVVCGWAKTLQGSPIRKRKC